MSPSTSSARPSRSTGRISRCRRRREISSMSSLRNTYRFPRAVSYVKAARDGKLETRGQSPRFSKKDGSSGVSSVVGQLSVNNSRDDDRAKRRSHSTDRKDLPSAVFPHVTETVKSLSVTRTSTLRVVERSLTSGIHPRSYALYSLGGR